MHFEKSSLNFSNSSLVIQTCPIHPICNGLSKGLTARHGSLGRQHCDDPNWVVKTRHSKVDPLQVAKDSKYAIFFAVGETTNRYTT